MKKLSKILTSLAALAVVGTMAFAPAAYADDPVCPAGSTSTACTNSTSLNNVIKIVANTLLFLLGIVSVVVIIIAGIRMATSAGNADSMAKARNSILYACIGIVVALSAYAVVNFVILRATS